MNLYTDALILLLILDLIHILFPGLGMLSILGTRTIVSGWIEIEKGDM